MYKQMLVLLILAVVASGCGRPHLAGSSWRMPWEAPPDEASGVIAPYERIASLRELSRGGLPADAARQQQIAAQLAEEIRQEADPLIRAEIVRTLAEYHTAEATSVLTSALADSEREVRAAACEAWGRRGGPEAIRLLGEAVLSDVSVDVRLAAAAALGQTEDPAAVAVLGPALEDHDPALQRRAVLALRKVTHKDFDNDVNRWRQYVRGETPEPAAPASIARQLGRFF
jgi:HEAT repeat protein